MIYLMDLEAYDDTVSPAVTRTIRFSSDGYTTEPTDTPANTFYEPRLKIPANYQRSLFGGDGTTSGAASSGFGEIVLAAVDGGLDYLRDYALDGRALTLYTLEDRLAAYTDRETYLRGTIEQAMFNWRTVTFRLRDRLAELQASPVLTSFYAGTTTGTGATAEGNADYKDRPKPRMWGKVRNVTPATANAYDLIYQVNDGAVNSIDAVYSNGVALTPSGSDRANLAALQGAVIAAGQYDTCNALGLFRLGGAPGGLVTCDATQGANAAARTAGQIAKAILTGPGGLAGADYDNATFTALDTANAAVCGVYVDSQRTVADVVSEVLNSVGAWIVPNRLGVFQVGRFAAPAITNPVATFTTVEILDSGEPVRRLPTGDQGRGVPAWRVTVRHTKNYTVMSAGQLAGAVTAANASFFNLEYRERRSESSALLTRHPNAPELVYDTLLTSESDAATESARRQALYGVQRDRYAIRVKSDYALGLNLGDTVELAIDRYGLSAGRNFVIIGIAENAESNVTELDLWG